MSTTPGNPGNYWNLKTVLEISLSLYGPPGNFCVKCRWSTELVSSHKTGYPDRIFKKLVALSIFATPLCCAYHVGWSLSSHAPLNSVDLQTCPGFFLKSLRNLLEICSVKFVDTLGTVYVTVSFLYTIRWQLGLEMCLAVTERYWFVVRRRSTSQSRETANVSLLHRVITWRRRPPDCGGQRRHRWLERNFLSSVCIRQFSRDCIKTVLWYRCPSWLLTVRT